MLQEAETQALCDLDLDRVYRSDVLTRRGTSSSVGKAFIRRTNDAVIPNEVFAWTSTTQVIVGSKGSGKTAVRLNFSHHGVPALVSNRPNELRQLEGARYLDLSMPPNAAVEAHARYLPKGLGHIHDAIEASRRILALEPDEELGGVGYAEETWSRAAEFLRKYSKWLWDSTGHVLDAPKILPGPEGSIDIHWDEPNYEILINIPADPTAEAGFYGDDRGAIKMKGKFDATTLNHGLHLWLAGAK